MALLVPIRKQGNTGVSRVTEQGEILQNDVQDRLVTLVALVEHM